MLPDVAACKQASGRRLAARKESALQHVSKTRGSLREWHYSGSGIQAMASKFRAFLNHPAGPKTVFFWAPTMKWGLVIAGLADISRPPELISTGTTCALTATGFIWARCDTPPFPLLVYRCSSLELLRCHPNYSQKYESPCRQCVRGLPECLPA